MITIPQCTTKANHLRSGYKKAAAAIAAIGTVVNIQYSECLEAIKNANNAATNKYKKIRFQFFLACTTCLRILFCIKYKPTKIVIQMNTSAADDHTWFGACGKER